MTHDEFPCHCLLQILWYPGRCNLVLIWDCGELLSMGLPDSSQAITIVIVGIMMAIRWLDAHVKENNRQETPAKDQLQELNCLKNLDIFETTCKILSNFDGSEKNMGQKTTDAMVQSQHDCMVVRICQEEYVEIQQRVQCVSAGH